MSVQIAGCRRGDAQGSKPAWNLLVCFRRVCVSLRHVSVTGSLWRQ